MTTKQLIAEINKALDQVPETALHDILEYLKGLQGKSEAEMLRSRHLGRILKEDKELLEKLAK